MLNNPKSERGPLKVGVSYRTVEVDRASISEEKRTVALSFSSELPVERWDGLEVLDHGSESVRLGRLRNGAAVLLNHNTDDQVGVVDKAWIDVETKVGRAIVRFSKSLRGSEIFQDVLDGVRSLVSVSYQIHSKILAEEKQGTLPIYRIRDWEPLEISLVAVPADATVGVGRSKEDEDQEVLVRRTKMETEEKVAAPPARPAPPPVPTVDVSAIRNAAERDERERVSTMLTLGARHKQEELARQFIESGRPLAEFRHVLLDKVGGDQRPIQPVPDPSIGMSSMDLDRYSLLGVIRALANPGDRKAQEAAAFEFECSAAALQAEKRGLRESAQVTVPLDVLRTARGQRDLITLTAGMGGNLVATDLLAASFIDLLRNKALTIQMGATLLTGLQGNVAIPQQSAAGTAYWVVEGTAPTESQLTIAQITMGPKTVGAFTDYSRRLLIQSSVDVENLVRNDLAKVLALAIDAAGINGPGTGNQPSGILTSTSIGSTTGGANGAVVTWGNIVALETALGSANADAGALGYLTNAAQRGRMKSTVKGTAGSLGYLWDMNDTPVNGYRCGISNNVPSNLTKGTSTGLCSAILFGNWADLLIGMWGGLDLMVDPYSGSSAGNVRVVALQDCDVNMRHPESFAAMKDAL